MYLDHVSKQSKGIFLISRSSFSTHFSHSVKFSEPGPSSWALTIISCIWSRRLTFSGTYLRGGGLGQRRRKWVSCVFGGHFPARNYCRFWVRLRLGCRTIIWLFFFGICLGCCVVCQFISVGSQGSVVFSVFVRLLEKWTSSYSSSWTSPASSYSYDSTRPSWSPTETATLPLYSNFGCYYYQ